MRQKIVTIGSLLSRYLGKRIDTIVAHNKRVMSFAEVASALVVWGELFGVFHYVAQQLAFVPTIIHPIAASATLLALVAHVSLD